MEEEVEDGELPRSKYFRIRPSPVGRKSPFSGLKGDQLKLAWAESRRKGAGYTATELRKLLNDNNVPFEPKEKVKKPPKQYVGLGKIEWDIPDRQFLYAPSIGKSIARVARNVSNLFSETMDKLNTIHSSMEDETIGYYLPARKGARKSFFEGRKGSIYHKRQGAGIARLFSRNGKITPEGAASSLRKFAETHEIPLQPLMDAYERGLVEGIQGSKKRKK